MLALSIFYQSRKAYIQLTKLFVLPFKTTLQRRLQNPNIMPGFSDPIFATLKMKIKTLDEKDRYLL